VRHEQQIHRARRGRRVGLDLVEQLGLNLLAQVVDAVVGVGEPVREWLSFELPDPQWQPARLRNGLLRGTALSDGQGLQMQWPTLSRDVLNPAPSTPPPTQSAASAGR